MSKPTFQQIGYLWKKQGSEEGHLFGKMKMDNLIFNVLVRPNKDKRKKDDPDFYLLIDEGEVDRSDPFWGFEYLFDM